MSKQGFIAFLISLIILLVSICFCCGSFILLIFSTSSVGTKDNIIENTVIDSQSTNEIAIIEVKGVIASSQDPLNRNYDMVQDILDKLDKAHTDSSVKAVILEIDTPGGTVYDSEVIATRITDIKKDKPVIALMNSSATSGGYYIAAPASRIVASPSSITGSIGVIVQTVNLDGLYDKLGIEVTTITSTNSDIKAFENLDDPNSKERRVLQAVLDDHYDKFIDTIVAGRGMDRPTVIKLADGSIYTGSQAKDLDLVDELGGLDTAIDLAQQEADITDSVVVRYDTYVSPFSSLGFGLLSKFDFVSGFSQNLDTEPGIYSYYLTE